MATLSTDGVRARWERLSERERTLVLVASAAGFLVVLAMVVWVVGGSLDEIADENAAMRQALKDIDTHRESYQKARAKSSQFESRIARTGMQLEGLLETAANSSDVQIDESNERPPQTLKNSKYIERDVDVRIRKCTLEQLSKFMKTIETGPNLVVVTGLNARIRDDKHEDLEVEMTVSTWERAPDAKGGKKSGGGGSGGGNGGGNGSGNKDREGQG